MNGIEVAPNMGGFAQFQDIVRHSESLAGDRPSGTERGPLSL
jgi:hypothetical protein